MLPLVRLSEPGADGDLSEACRTSGMFYLADHGVSQSLLDSAMLVNRRLFDLDTESKREIGTAHSSCYRGWGLLKNFRDWREQIHLGVEAEKITAGPDYWKLWGPNLWPPVPDYRETMLEFFDAMETLARRLLQSLEKSMQKPDGFFAERMLDRPYLLAKPMSYHPQIDESARVGVTAHCDWSWLTFLLQDDVGGLEARDISGVWHTVGGTEMVVNTGELLELESGIYRASPHRVVNSRIDRQRYSLPFFVSPALDAEIRPANGFSPAQEPEHVHRVIAPGAVTAPFIFGDSEYRRKALGQWCYDSACRVKV